MIAYRLSLSVIFLASVSCAFAYEPPQYSLSDVVARAEAIFIGRVIELKEEEIGRYAVRSSATVRVIECILNIDCEEIKEIKILFYSQTFVDRAFPVNFPISTNIFFPMRERITSSEIYFDSDWENGIDIAYLIADSEFSGSYADTTKLTLHNIYLPSIKEKITLKEIKHLIHGVGY